MTDRDFLIWLHQRLVNVHHEKPFVDYMHFLRDVIAGTPKDKQSRGERVSMTSSEVLIEIEAMERAK